MRPVRTAVYRFFDAAGDLLYIGIAENPDGRWKKHASRKPWWPEVARKTVEWFDNREEAGAAEHRAIRTEHARHNIAGSPWAPKPRELKDNEVLAGAGGPILGRLVDRVKRDRSIVFFVRPDMNRTQLVALVPLEFYDAVMAAGGADAAVAILRRAGGSA